jgi:chromosome segregation ATPase
MPTEQLTYAQIAKRLSVSPEAARAIVKRPRLPRSRRNDGKTLAAIDLTEIRHKPLPARSPRGRRSVTDVVATLKARVAELETELAQAEERSAGHRVDFERERERADQLVTTQDRMVAELEALHSLLRSLLEAAQQAAPPVTSRTPDMARHHMARDDSLAQSMRSLLEAAQAARLEAAQQAARPVTSRTWRETRWSERWRWLRRTG